MSAEGDVKHSHEEKGERLITDCMWHHEKVVHLHYIEVRCMFLPIKMILVAVVRPTIVMENVHFDM